MSDKDPKDEILNALDKLDKDSARIELRKKNLNDSKKISASEVHVSKEDKIKSEVKNQNAEYFNNLKDKAIQGGILFIITLIIVSALNRDQQTTLIENFIIIFLCLGMVAAKKR